MDGVHGSQVRGVAGLERVSEPKGFSPHCMPMHALPPAGPGVDFAGAFGTRRGVLVP